MTGFRVGIVWQGNRKNTGDRWRSVSLEKFAPLATIPGVTLISLQKGVGAEQLRARPGLALNLGDDLDRDGPFLDTAAIIRNLHLVMTVDTALAHLAGAMGAPAWIALQFSPHWPWLLKPRGQPLVSQPALFRQLRPNDWDDVFARINLALQERIILLGYQL